MPTWQPYKAGIITHVILIWSMEKLHIDPEELGDKLISKADLYKIYKYHVRGFWRKTLLMFNVYILIIG